MSEKPATSKVRKNNRRAVLEISAGGIVFKKFKKGAGIGFILDPFGKWAFAKGHVEKGETVKEAAVRETKEEMGLDSLQVVAPLGRIGYWFREKYRPKTKGRLIHKFVYYFLMEAPRAAKARPQHAEKIHRVVWVPREKALKFSSYKDVRPALEKALQKINLVYK